MKASLNSDEKPCSQILGVLRDNQVMEVIQIYNISWEVIPQKAWNRVLAELSVGSYVATLPYKSMYDYETWKIPLPRELKATRVDEPMDITVPLVMEYKRVVVESPLLESAWQRIT